jgi:high-affinity Fe2+/Pb2+ permease
MITSIASTAFVLFREGFEIWLIMCLALNYVQDSVRRSIIWRAFWISIIHTIVLAVGISYWITDHSVLEKYEGVMYLITAGILAWVAYGCHSAQQHVKDLPMRNTWWLGVAVFGIILREGVEIILFLMGIYTVDPNWQWMMLGAGMGLMALALLIHLANHQIKKIPVSSIFRFSRFIFIVLAIYFAHKGIGELI